MNDAPSRQVSREVPTRRGAPHEGFDLDICRRGRGLARCRDQLLELHRLAGLKR